MFRDDYYTQPEKVRQRTSGQFYGYCNRLCRSSLITGFPVIASSKSIVRKIVKTCVFLICTAGFCYQTSDFLRMYFAYPTNVDVNMYIPEQFEMPAITVCNKNRIKRKLLCTLEKDKCQIYTKVTEFCSLYPTYCNPSEGEGDEDDIVLATVYNHYVNPPNRSWEYVQKMGFSQKDTIHRCLIESEGTKRACMNFMYVPAVDNIGQPNNCYAVESLWGKPDSEVEEIPTTTKITMKLKLHPEEYLKSKDIVQFYFAVHDAYMLMNPMMEGMMLEAGKNYNVYVTQVVKIFLPRPYITNCTNYMKLWKKNGGYGPLNQKMCIEKCKMSAMLKNSSCVDSRISYPNNHTICHDGYNNRTLVSACSKMCRPACRDITYHVRTEIMEDLGTTCPKSDNVCPIAAAVLTFDFSRMEITQFEHQPKYESVEMFSYIGGYMGMWLGISLVALFDFLETIGYLVYYPFKRKARKKTKKFHHFNSQQLFYRRYY